MRVVKLRESDEERRLRHAACLLSDIGWRVHPDHRGEQTLTQIINGNFGDVSHQGRAFVGLSVFYRYAGLSEENQPPEIIQDLVSASMLERARVLGARRQSLMRAGRPNAEISTQELERDCALGAPERRWFESALERLGLSARAYHRVLRVARTIADLDGGTALLEREHLAEALQYRRL